MEANIIAIDEASKITPEMMATIRSHHDSIARRAGIGAGIDVGGKAFFRMGTSLRSLPGAMAYALKPHGDA